LSTTEVIESLYRRLRDLKTVPEAIKEWKTYSLSDQLLAPSEKIKIAGSLKDQVPSSEAYSLTPHVSESPPISEVHRLTSFSRFTEAVTAPSETYALKQYVDLTKFTEYDPNNDLTVTNERVTWDTLNRSQDTGLERDYGAGHFGDFVHEFDVYFSSIEAGDADNRTVIILWYLSVYPWPSSTDVLRLYARQLGDQDNCFDLVFFQRTGGVNDWVKFGTATFYTGNVYYFRVERSGSYCRVRVYSDPERTNPIEDIVETGLTTTYRYLCLSSVRAWAADPYDWSTGYLEYLNIRE